jgi:hypothetical protein
MDWVVNLLVTVFAKMAIQNNYFAITGVSPPSPTIKKMKQLLVFLPALFIISLLACTKQSNKLSVKSDARLPEELMPVCILDKIEALKIQPKLNPPAVAYEYTYANQKVYYITSGCCDQYNLLYDDNCNVLCAPDGGITGRGDGKCSDFLQAATDEKLIWKDGR